jgi:DNA-binding NarL/FixJ family response regulator
MDQIRILIADDHTLLRDALAELLDSEDDMNVVAVAGSADRAVRLAGEVRPDIVLLDIEMPGNQRPCDTVGKLRDTAPGTRILVITMHDEAAIVRAMLPLGISGFLHKTVTHKAVSEAVRGAFIPGAPVTVSLSAGTLLAPAPEECGPLSPREGEVVGLVSRGLSNYQIARRLGIVEGTVKRHMRSIFDKLAARSRVEAVNRAVELGLVAPIVPQRQSDPHPQMPIPIPPPTGKIAPVT